MRKHSTKLALSCAIYCGVGLTHQANAQETNRIPLTPEGKSEVAAAPKQKDPRKVKIKPTNRAKIAALQKKTAESKARRNMTPQERRKANAALKGKRFQASGAQDNSSTTDSLAARKNKRTPNASAFSRLKKKGAKGKIKKTSQLRHKKLILNNTNGTKSPLKATGSKSKLHPDTHKKLRAATAKLHRNRLKNPNMDKGAVHKAMKDSGVNEKGNVIGPIHPLLMHPEEAAQMTAPKVVEAEAPKVVEVEAPKTEEAKGPSELAKRSKQMHKESMKSAIAVRRTSRVMTKSARAEQSADSAPAAG